MYDPCLKGTLVSSTSVGVKSLEERGGGGGRREGVCIGIIGFGNSLNLAIARQDQTEEQEIDCDEKGVSGGAVHSDERGGRWEKKKSASHRRTKVWRKRVRNGMTRQGGQDQQRKRNVRRGGGLIPVSIRGAR